MVARPIAGPRRPLCRLWPRIKDRLLLYKVYAHDAPIVLGEDALYRAARAVEFVARLADAQARARRTRVRKPRPQPQPHRRLARAVFLAPFDGDVDGGGLVEAVVTQSVVAPYEPLVLEPAWHGRGMGEARRGARDQECRGR